MVLKRKLKSLDDIDEALRDNYEKKGEEFVLKVEGDEDLETKLAEFRNNNREWKKKYEDLETKAKDFDGIDKEKYQQGLDALKQLSELKDKDLLDAGKIDEVFKNRTATLKEELNSQIKAKDDALKEAHKRLDDFKGRLSTTMRNDQVVAAVNKVGKLRAGALDDVKYRAQDVFRMSEDGTKLETITDNGRRNYDAEGEPFTTESWAQHLLTSASHLFEGGGGGGAGGGKKGGGAQSERFIDRDDQAAFEKNIDKIAKGEVKIKYD
jgi:hypothetical protein